MLHLLRAPSFLLPRAVRCYTPSVYQTATTKWQLEGIPRPKSILEDDDAVIDLSEDNATVDGARPGTPPVHLRAPTGKPTPHEYRAHRDTIRKAFPEGWSPPKKLSREAMDALRQLHRADPGQFTTALLAEKFRISPEAVRRILKSKWEPPVEKRTRLAIRERQERAEFRKGVVEQQMQETDTLIMLRKMQKVERKLARRSSRQHDTEDDDLPSASGNADGFSFQ
ncbi:hypothetical protein D9619_008014 [Psilocybe cf. subviscida]|uniref:Required for respiratory growth protein 9, mitochondrial n=1 Tax=Psilocybe cf. subviscida TaxID=2480587 RepID=A0A8H5ATC8_9AGAR|nr:hypothetical protein D9619_008014 [Psilocybe cf. subviscida]